VTLPLAFLPIEHYLAVCARFADAISCDWSVFYLLLGCTDGIIRSPARAVEVERFDYYGMNVMRDIPFTLADRVLAYSIALLDLGQYYKVHRATHGYTDYSDTTDPDGRRSDSSHCDEIV